MNHETKELFRKSLPEGLRQFFLKSGFALAPEALPRAVFENFHEWSWLDSSLQALKDRGFAPRTILDIGAYQGEWTRTAKAIFPEASVIMVDAQEGKRPFLQKVKDEFSSGVDFHIAFVGAEDDRELTFYEMETGSSAFEEQSSVPRTKKQVRTRSLGSILRQAGWTGVDFLKLDVQGYELEILKGAGNILDGVEFVLMEASLQRLNAGAPLLDEVIAFMRAKGFLAYDICSFFRRPPGRILSQVDLLLVRESSRFSPLQK